MCLECKSTVVPRDKADEYRLDELTPNAHPRRNGSIKRKADFSDSPMPRKVSRPEQNGTSKAPAKNLKPVDGLNAIPFSERQNAGQIIESINDHLSIAEAPFAPFSEARIRTIANTDIKKFSYKPMAMRLSDSSEILDERIDDFVALIQKHHNIEESSFGNAASQSTNEIVAVGRIASDTPESKLNAASVVLEMSRRTGAGLRIPLKIDALPSYHFFPGQIVALKGTNASGMYFTVSEILNAPQLPMPVSTPQTLESINEKLKSSSGTPLNIMFASGPYTCDDNLEYAALQALCQKAADDSVDALILTGPFLDVEHPLLATGDFNVPDTIKNIDLDSTMSTLFRLWISTPLQRLCAANPSITVILVPSIRDAVSRHVSWPQEQLKKAELGLPKQVKMLPNPCFISLNEMVIAISSQDILYELSREQIASGANRPDLLTTLPKYLIEQRHFFPLFPPMSREKLPHGTDTRATGAVLDIGYLKLGEWLNVKPDVLLTPSALTPSVKVVESVMVVNPGFLSKRKAAGTFARMSLQGRVLGEEEKGEQSVTHKVFERARVDVVRI